MQNVRRIKQKLLLGQHLLKNHRRKKKGAYKKKVRVWCDIDSVTRQWPLVKSRGSQSLCQATLIPFMTSQLTATRDAVLPRVH